MVICDEKYAPIITISLIHQIQNVHKCTKYAAFYWFFLLQMHCSDLLTFQAWHRTRRHFFASRSLAHLHSCCKHFELNGIVCCHFHTFTSMCFIFYIVLTWEILYTWHLEQYNDISARHCRWVSVCVCVWVYCACHYTFDTRGYFQCILFFSTSIAATNT